MTPLWPARPGWNRLLMAPSAVKAHRPADCVPAIPRALAISSSFSRNRFPAAAAAPNVPVVPVRCHPLNREAFGPVARLTRIIVSYPATMAASISLPEAPIASPTATAAGITGAPGWTFVLW